MDKQVHKNNADNINLCSANAKNYIKNLPGKEINDGKYGR